MVILTIDDLTEESTAAYLIRNRNGIVDCLCQVEGLLNLLPQTATATKKTGTDVTELKQLLSDFQSTLWRIQTLLQELEEHVEGWSGVEAAD